MQFSIGIDRTVSFWLQQRQNDSSQKNQSIIACRCSRVTHRMAVAAIGFDRMLTIGKRTRNQLVEISCKLIMVAL